MPLREVAVERGVRLGPFDVDAGPVQRIRRRIGIRRGPTEEPRAVLHEQALGGRPGAARLAQVPEPPDHVERLGRGVVLPLLLTSGQGLDRGGILRRGDRLEPEIALHREDGLQPGQPVRLGLVERDPEPPLAEKAEPRPLHAHDGEPAEDPRGRLPHRLVALAPVDPVDEPRAALDR